jgi:hypothetical protein
MKDQPNIDEIAIIQNNDEYEIFPESRSRSLQRQLNGKINIGHEIVSLVKNGFLPKSVSLDVQTLGRVLMVENDVEPYPGGWKDNLNNATLNKNVKCTRIWCRTKFDKYLKIPQNLMSPKDSDMRIIKEHYPFEFINEQASIPSVGETVWVIHPLAYGFLNPVGVYLYQSSHTPGVAPLDRERVAQSVRDFLDKPFAPLEAPETLDDPNDECSGDRATSGNSCGWRGGQSIGKLDLRTITNPDGKFGLRLTPSAKEAWEKMRKAAITSNVYLSATSAFRTYKEQEEQYKKSKPGFAATPGNSRHQSGIAIDINTKKSVKSPEYIWLARHAHLFGFARTVEKEPWHWVYFGTPAASSRRPPWT